MAPASLKKPHCHWEENSSRKGLWFEIWSGKKEICLRERLQLWKDSCIQPVHFLQLLSRRNISDSVRKKKTWRVGFLFGAIIDTAFKRMYYLLLESCETRIEVWTSAYQAALVCGKISHSAPFQCLNIHLCIMWAAHNNTVLSLKENPHVWVCIVQSLNIRRIFLQEKVFWEEKKKIHNLISLFVVAKALWEKWSPA